MGVAWAAWAPKVVRCGRGVRCVSGRRVGIRGDRTRLWGPGPSSGRQSRAPRSLQGPSTVRRWAAPCPEH
eukprot:5682484-Pyramimonas_sp.AAC.1